MKRSKGVSTFVATLVLVSISLTLSYVVYEGVGKLAPPRQVAYANETSELPSDPLLVHVVVDASSPSQPTSLVVDGTDSNSGILYFNGSAYGSSGHLCSGDATTFFSVFTGTGTLLVNGNGRSWIDGYWTNSLSVQAGWQEVMLSNATSCAIVDTDGLGVTYPGSGVSTVPTIGNMPSAHFEFYVPSDGGHHDLLLVFPGGYDQIA